MVHTWTLKGKKRYRYYACQRAQKQGWAACPTKAVPAREVEQFVVEGIRAIGADRDIVAATIEEAQKQHAEQVAALEADRAAGERDILALTADVARAGKEKGKGAAARLAELQERLAAAERRGTEIREEIVAAGREVIDQRDITGALSLFDPVWDALFPKEQARILRLLVERVGYDGGKGTLAITFRPTGIKALAREVGGARTEVAR
jgi:site-specific DNA recombinase